MGYTILMCARPADEPHESRTSSQDALAQESKPATDPVEESKPATLADRLLTWAETNGMTGPQDGPDRTLNPGWRSGRYWPSLSFRVGPVAGYGDTLREAVHNCADALTEHGWPDDRPEGERYDPDNDDSRAYG